MSSLSPQVRGAMSASIGDPMSMRGNNRPLIDVRYNQSAATVNVWNISERLRVISGRLPPPPIPSERPALPENRPAGDRPCVHPRRDDAGVRRRRRRRGRAAVAAAEPERDTAEPESKRGGGQAVCAAEQNARLMARLAHLWWLF